jgi:uncharacterized repeat protein (TIGR01451 family)
VSAFDLSKKRNKTTSMYLVLMLRIAFPTALMCLGLSVQAQTSACAANETQQVWSFASPNDWLPQGAGTLNTTLAGTPNGTISVAAVADITGAVATYPRTDTYGGIASTYVYYVDRTASGISNTTTFTFSKPISKLRLIAIDIDSNSGTNPTGKYQDQVTITGTSPTGATVTPTAVAANTTYVTVAGNVATSVGVDANNCPQTGTLNGVNAGDCNVTYSFTAPITVLNFTYGNGPLATGNPPGQLVAIASLGFCVQNPDLSLVKDDGGASFVAGSTGAYSFTVSNVGSAATSGTTTVKDILPAGMSFTAPLTAGGANGALYTCAVSTTTNANDTATCTTTTAIAASGTNVFTLPVAVASTVASGTTLTNKAKVFGGNDPNKAAEATTGAISACASDSLAGAVANAGCGFETTPITAAASVVITKTDSKTVATSGGTNNYVVTLTNQGPSVANGLIVTDVVSAGLTCPGTNVVTCSGAVNGAVCPAASNITTLTGAGITVATLPVTGALQFSYTCNVN